MQTDLCLNTIPPESYWSKCEREWRNGRTIGQVNVHLLLPWAVQSTNWRWFIQWTNGATEHQASNTVFSTSSGSVRALDKRAEVPHQACSARCLGLFSSLSHSLTYYRLYFCQKESRLKRFLLPANKHDTIYYSHYSQMNIAIAITLLLESNRKRGKCNVHVWDNLSSISFEDTLLILVKLFFFFSKENAFCHITFKRWKLMFNLQKWADYWVLLWCCTEVHVPQSGAMSSDVGIFHDAMNTEKLMSVFKCIHSWNAISKEEVWVDSK